MVPDQAVDSIIVSNCVPGPKFNDNLDIAVSRDDSFGLVELEDVTWIGEELILSIEF